MISVKKIKRIITKLLISLLFTLVASNFAYAGEEEDHSKNTIIISNDGIAKVVDSNGQISLSPLDRNIGKGEIKFGGILADASSFQNKNVNRDQSYHRGGKICITDNLNTDSMTFYLHPYDEENQHNYCLMKTD